MDKNSGTVCKVVHVLDHQKSGNAVSQTFSVGDKTKTTESVSVMR